VSVANAAAAAPVDARVEATALAATRVGLAAADEAGGSALDAGELKVVVAAEWVVGVPLQAEDMNGTSSSESGARSLQRTAGSVPHRSDNADTGEHSARCGAHAAIKPCCERGRTNAIAPAAKQSSAKSAQRPGQELRSRGAYVTALDPILAHGALSIRLHTVLEIAEYAQLIE